MSSQQQASSFPFTRRAEIFFKVPLWAGKWLEYYVVFKDLLLVDAFVIRLAYFYNLKWDYF